MACSYDVVIPTTADSLQSRLGPLASPFIT